MPTWTERTEIIALLGIAIVSQAIGNVLLSQGMKSISEGSPTIWSDWLAVALQAVRTPSILFGVGFLIMFFVLFATTLSRADLSFVLPAISSEVIVNVAFANYFLQETVSTTRWLGVVLISIGVVLVVRSSPKTFGIENEPVVVRQEVNR
jgi:multidrug transporter EmrE-like cation transporter